MKKSIFTIMLLLVVTLFASQSQAVCQTGDTTVPDRIVDFTARPMGLNKVELRWTVPKTVSEIASYDIRYRANTALNGFNWATSTKITGTPTPKTTAGFAENMMIDMPAGSVLYFGIKATNDCGKINTLSNIQQVNNPITAPTSNYVIVDSSTVNVSGSSTSTVSINTNGIMGYSFFVLYDASIAINNIAPSAKPGAFQGLVDSNLDPISTNAQEYLAKLLDAYGTTGKKVALVSGASVDVQVGTIPLFDITFTGITTGSTALLIVPEHASTWSATAPSNPSDLYPFPTPQASLITVQ